MQRVIVVCVGKMKEKFYIEAAAEYVKRLSRFCKLEIVELPEERLPDHPSQAQIDAALSREAEAIRGKLPPSSRVIALCVEGRLRSSEELARTMAAWSGGVERGLENGWCSSSAGPSASTSPSRRRRGDRLSMSPMTFPHTWPG